MWRWLLPETCWLCAFGGTLCPELYQITKRANSALLLDLKLRALGWAEGHLEESMWESRKTKC